MEKIRSPNDAWIVIEKRGIGEIAKSSRGIAPGPHNGGLTVPHMNPPSGHGQSVDVRWVMVYGHKTESFIKNGGQQKCLGRAQRPMFPSYRNQPVDMLSKSTD